MEAYQVLIYILIIFFGLAIGSFLNVVIARFDDLQSIIKTRSHCPKCKKTLPWYDLIPFISYLLLFGRCRNCQKPISLQYPLVEVLTAVILVLIYSRFGFSWESLFLFFISAILIVIACYDWLHSEIPDILVYIALGLALILDVYLLGKQGLFLDTSAWLAYGAGFAIGLGLFGFLVIISREKWMGKGDVLLASFMGLFLGFPDILMALFLSFVFGAVFSLILMVLKQKTLKDTIPFGPFLIGATFVTLFWGEELVRVYLLKMGL